MGERGETRKRKVRGGRFTISFVKKEFGGFFLNVGLYVVNNYTLFISKAFFSGL